MTQVLTSRCRRIAAMSVVIFPAQDQQRVLADRTLRTEAYRGANTHLTVWEPPNLLLAFRVPPDMNIGHGDPDLIVRRRTARHPSSRHILERTRVRNGLMNMNQKDLQLCSYFELFMMRWMRFFGPFVFSEESHICWQSAVHRCTAAIRHNAPDISPEMKHVSGIVRDGGNWTVWTCGVSWWSLDKSHTSVQEIIDFSFVCVVHQLLIAQEYVEGIAFCFVLNGNTHERVYNLWNIRYVNFDCLKTGSGGHFQACLRMVRETKAVFEMF
jgi:hypothetical protein